MTNPDTHLFWITSRAAGTVALVLASATVGFGLMMCARIRPGSVRDRRAIHEVLSLSVMVAIAVHGLSLIGDKYLHPSLLDVTLPFASSYKSTWTSLGIISGWGLIFLGLSYYVRGRIGQNRWKLIHRFTLVAWVGALVHSFTEGSDAGQAWFVALIVLTALPAVIALSLRVTRSLNPRSRLGSAPT